MSAQHEYTQGICEDGAAILCDGVPMSIEQIIEQLRQRDELAEDLRAVVIGIECEHGDHHGLYLEPSKALLAKAGAV